MLVPTILCGGAGSRLWPVSRELAPKPFIRLLGKESLLEKTFLRSLPLPEIAEILVVTNRELAFKAQDELCPLAKAKTAPSLTFILEPFGKNTAAAVAAAALQIKRVYGEKAVMLVLPADHLILNEEAFRQAVEKAVAFAQTGKLVTFGIQPYAPQTSYGYIEAQGNTVLSFIEKPPLEKANAFVASGRFLWNTGMFCFLAERIIQELEQYCPHLLTTMTACLEDSSTLKGEVFTQITLAPESFEKVPESSIDYAVMEKSCQLAVIPCDLGWSDVGSWNVLDNLIHPDAQGNRISGEALLYEANNCTIQSADRLVGVVGVENLFIIDTLDALLIVEKSRTQEVKHLYSTLKNQDHPAYKFHTKASGNPCE